MTLQALATLQQPAPTMAARDLKLTLDALDQDMKNVKAMITGLVQNPLDVAARRVN